MKRSLGLSSAMGLLVCLFSCNSTDETASNEEAVGQEVSMPKVEEKMPLETKVIEKPTVELNEGNTWEANPETVQGIQVMMGLMETFDVEGDVSTYEGLNDSLYAAYKSIFENCTMKGEGHVQLHNFLLPIQDYFEALKTEDQDQFKYNFGELKEHLNTFENYFH